ncbi:MAG: PKD domain-containing protein [Flavobacteriales bacterium]|nr:PKD domain-containing protein [Flavobacteriales bacterium]
MFAWVRLTLLLLGLVRALIGNAQQIYVSTASGAIFLCDPSTCSSTFVCQAGQAPFDIAYDPATSTMYAVTNQGQFGTIDLVGGTFSAISSPPVVLNALAFSPTGELFTASEEGDSLYTLDPGTGALTNLGSMNFPGISGGDFWWVDGQMYLSTYGLEVVQVDPITTMNSVLLGSATGPTTLYGMVTIGACPTQVICTSLDDLYLMDMETLECTVLCADLLPLFSEATGAAPVSNSGSSVLQASFSYEPISPCTPGTIQLQNLGGGTFWTWDFGDGSPVVTTEAPIHTYAGPGSYEITLVASDTGACAGVDTAVQVVEIDDVVEPTAEFTITPEGPCGTNGIEIDASFSGTNLALQWNMGDGTSVAGPVSGHTYTAPGNFTVTVVVTDTVCGGSVSVSRNVVLSDQLAIDLGPDTVLCEGDELTIEVSEPGASFTWNTGATDPGITVTPGTYWVQVEVGNCLGSDTIHIGSSIPSSLPDPSPICFGDSARLQAPTDWNTVVWSTGDTSAVIHISEPGIHGYFATNSAGCSTEGSFSLVVLPAEATLYAPNAFTPNGDGINDMFRIEGHADEARLTIFDRWGEEVFASEELIWDGSFKGAPPKEDVFVYTLSYSSACSPSRISHVGHVTVLP